MKTSNQIEYALLTDLGKIRTNNEDKYMYAFNDNILLIGVIDGVGGYEGGEIAAELCQKSIEDDFLQTEEIRVNTSQKLNTMAIRANNLIVSERSKNDNLKRMSCVASIAVLDKDKEMLHFAHVGDTRGYVFRNGELMKFTHDHSIVGFLEESGAILEEDALRHPRRNEISKLFGEKELSEVDSSYVETGSHSFYAQDIVLFCSDGLTDLVCKAEMEQILLTDNTLEDKAKALINRANELGGKDNVTVALASYFDFKMNGKNSTSGRNFVTIAPESTDKTSKSKKNSYVFVALFFLLGVLVGFLANTQGSKFWINRYILPGDSAICVDSINSPQNSSISEGANLPDIKQNSVDHSAND